MASELKPCPFCGAEPVHVLHEAHTHSVLLKRFMPDLPDAKEQHEIACDDCGVGVLRVIEDEAIAAWNRRKETTP